MCVAQSGKSDESGDNPGLLRARVVSQQLPASSATIHLQVDYRRLHPPAIQLLSILHPRARSLPASTSLRTVTTLGRRRLPRPATRSRTRRSLTGCLRAALQRDQRTQCRTVGPAVYPGQTTRARYTGGTPPCTTRALYTHPSTPPCCTWTSLDHRAAP